MRTIPELAREAATKIKEQGELAFFPVQDAGIVIKGNCRYYAVNESKVKRCAIGIIVPDDVAQKMEEANHGSPWGIRDWFRVQMEVSARDYLRDEIFGSADEDDKEAADRLEWIVLIQRAHDEAKGDVKLACKRLEWVAKEFEKNGNACTHNRYAMWPQL